MPADFAERVYAGVLGKLIGVYLGRPIEGWLWDKIEEKIGEVDHYIKVDNHIKGRVNAPLVVTDDDVTGTFTFLRALEDEGYSRDLTAEQIGNNWLNYTIPERTIFWWGGVGNSTEHTAWARLAAGIKAPLSGSMATNGKVISEQIGAQIFIDGWAMVAPGDPEFAADLARRAGSVSHDGEAIYGAQVIAAIEAQAFVESDMNKLLDTGLSVIPADSVIARVIHDVRNWHAQSDDWRATRTKIGEIYNYDIYGGACHMVPNHALIIMALLHGNGDFTRSQMIINTAGWDTDCNAANVGCILGIRDGLATFDVSYDWRGPVADRMYLSTADGGRGITDALTESYRIITAAAKLRGESTIAPADGAKFHFSLPGSVQGFERDPESGAGTVSNPAGGALRIQPTGSDTVRVLTPTFVPPEAINMPGYQLFASPTLYAGQTVTAIVANVGESAANVGLVLRVYGEGDASTIITGPSQSVAVSGESVELSWTIPATGGNPINAIGLDVSGGTVALQTMDWSGAPTVTFQRPADSPIATWFDQPSIPPSTMWRKAFVDAVDIYGHWWKEAFRISQNEGRGVMAQGSHDWADYRVTATIQPMLAASAGIAARVQGLTRYYALTLTDKGTVQLIKLDDTESVLAEQPFAWNVFDEYEMTLEVNGETITGSVGGVTLTATDSGTRLRTGSAGYTIQVGTMASQALSVAPIA